MPAYDTLVDLIYQISYNTALMNMLPAGGKLGFLALAIYLTMHATLSATPFVKPPNSVPAPTIMPKATDIKKTANSYKLTMDTDLYMLHKNM